MLTSNRVVHTALAVLAMGTMVGCTSESRSVNDQQVAARVPPDTVAAASTVDLVDSAAGVLSRRVEPQQYFDETRAAMASRETARARTSLLAAASFLRRQADSAAGDVREQLRVVARDLDTIAVGRLQDVPIRRLDHVFARANLAESDRHLARAMSAWTGKDTARTADELLMAADHLERAAKDGKVPASPARLEATAAARALATDLLTRAPVPPDRLPRTRDALHEASRSLRDQL